MGGAIFVGRTHQLDGTGESRSGLAVEDQNLDDICDDRDRNGLRRRRSCPPGASAWGHGLKDALISRRWVAIRYSFLKSSHIDLNAKLDVRLREVTLGQALVQIRGEVGRPRIVKRVPVPVRAQRWPKVILQVH